MSTPPERRRRSPGGSGIALKAEEQLPVSMHPFLDLETAEPRTSESSSSLLPEWVPGVPVYSQENSPQKAPYIQSGPTTFMGSDAPPKKKGSKKLLSAIAGLGLLGIFFLAFSAYRGSRKLTLSKAMEAIGEGESREDFVRVQGTEFMLDCRPFYIAGFNAHDLIPKALATTSDHKTFGNREGKDLVEEMLRNASSLGLNVARIYAHTSDPEHPILESPGKYNQDALEAMDFVLDVARQLGLKVMLSFADNWKFNGGVDQMLEWSKTVKKRSQKRPAEQTGDFDDQELPEDVKEYEVARHSLFFNDTGAKSIYKDYVKAIVTRENSVNGRKYSEDPTLMSWGLLNEPRCETWKVPECKRTFQAWVEEMSAYVKSLDSTHLVTIGSEGFFGDDSIKVKNNPQDWGGQIGQDFSANHKPSTVDYLTIHLWPDNWERPEKSFQKEWLQSHMDVAKKTLKKPLVLEEFGKKLIETSDNNDVFRQAIDKLRNPVFENTFQMVETALQKAQPLQGSMFWRWDLIVYDNQARADYGVRDYDTTMQLIGSHAAFVKRWMNTQPPAAACGLPCWVPSDTDNRCLNAPKVCASQLKTAKKKSGDKPTYATQKACCRPGTGAFPAGCSA